VSGIDKEFRPLVKRLQKLGYAVATKGHKGHPKVLRPDGSLVCPLPTSSSDVRAVKNAVAQLRANGVPL
jgi:hypothetical protein